MTMKSKDPLTRREREIMDVLYRHGELTATEVVERLPGSPSNSAVRTILRILEDKGHVRHEQEGMRYLYKTTVNLQRARQSALDHLVSTFFDGSPEDVVTALIDERRKRMTPEQLTSISLLIERAKKAGR